jgi:hypothetical protein
MMVVFDIINVVFFLRNGIVIGFGLRLRGCDGYSMTLCHIGYFGIKWGLN